VETVLIHVDRRTDITKVTVAFRQHANSPENEVKKLYKGHLKPLPQYLHVDLSAVTFVHIGKKTTRKLQLNMSRVLIEGLFNDNVSSSDYVKYNGRICEEQIGKVRKETVVARRSLQQKQTTKYLEKGNRPADRGLQPGPSK